MATSPIRRQSWDPHILDMLSTESHTFKSTVEQQDAYDEALSCLTTAQREALEARLHGLSYSQCAEQLEISIRSVRTREERALDRLRKLALTNPELFHDLAGRLISLED